MRNEKQIIVDLIGRELERAQRAYTDAIAEHAAHLAGANVWDEHNPDDGCGGMSMNPYRPGQKGDRELDARNYFDTMKRVHKLAIDTFLEDDNA